MVSFTYVIMVARESINAQLALSVLKAYLWSQLKTSGTLSGVKPRFSWRVYRRPFGGMKGRWKAAMCACTPSLTLGLAIFAPEVSTEATDNRTANSNLPQI